MTKQTPHDECDKKAYVTPYTHVATLHMQGGIMLATSKDPLSNNKKVDIADQNQESDDLIWKN